ncbi:AGAP005637-PA-like protein [Anopheles sinensis]|uniref:AGAP005637-PA-like protein n=1 Tax=Anopheles sinensis TaxID=74873 RepID=A0A084WK57_ANOSI|nr:AGAP005637-PA-like protein [Anopheles sinensis]
MEEVRFTINGQLHTVNASTVPVDTSLNTFIRDHAHLKGTKFMCREGGCGACVVTVSGYHPVTRERRSWAANSCLLSVFSCDGLDILTVEGIGGKRKGVYNPVQRRLAEQGGSQCGYCSPGMVMNMYSLLAQSSLQQRQEPKEGGSEQQPLTETQIEDAFDGNICRCTGYRPILDAFKSFAQDRQGQLDAVIDIEDLTRLCPRTAMACSGKQTDACQGPPSPAARSLTFSDERKWHKVTSFTEAFAVLNAIEGEPYMLVAGNTAHGVYRRSDALRVFIDVSSIEELHRHTRTPGALVVGAGVRLAKFITILEEMAAEYLNFSYCAEMARHVRLVANGPVRNEGTIAGNLMIKHQHPEFPSDVFLLLETIGATLVIASSNEQLFTVSPLDFLKLNMHKRILTTVRFPPHDYVATTLRSYKVMPVAQNSRAYVNGAFLLSLCPEQKVCLAITVCFGGISPTFVHAQKTEAFLTGKALFDEGGTVLSEAMRILERELMPDWVLPDATPAYRKGLAVSLFYKFALSVHPTAAKVLRSGATLLQRPAVSSGQQRTDTFPKRWPLTASIPKLEGLAQCAGEAEFINDMPALPNELHGAFVLTNEINCRIVQIDASEALALPGVRAFFCAKDIPGFNNFMPLEMGFPEVEEIFCSGEVQFAGQVVGLVCASSFELANRAAGLVKIEYQRRTNRMVLPTVQDVVEALDYSRVRDQPYDRQGARFLQAREGPIKISGRYELRGQYHYSMETQVCLCVPRVDSMDVYCATQWMDLVQIGISQALAVPEASLNLTVRRVGGAYGAKITRATQIACACAIAAHRTGVPVRMILPLETAMSGTGKRAGTVSEYEVSVDETGHIAKLSHTYIHDSGAALNIALGGLTSDAFKNCYRTDLWNLRGKLARTDTPPNTWARSPGISEGIAMVENIMEHIAHRTGLDPVDVRLANIGRESRMAQLLPRFRRQVAYDERKEAIDRFNGEHRWRKRGIAILPMQYPLELTTMKSAVVSVHNDDGSVTIVHGGIEMGQGINTKAVQVAAHLLGVPMEQIVVRPTSSLLNANSNGSNHSQATDSVAFAVKKCCEILLDRLRPYRTLLRRTSWTEQVRRAALDEVDLQASYFATSANIQPYIIWGVACGEVEVDTLTGQTLVRRVDILEDVGESLNPAIDVGQIEGAFVMGLGYHLTETLVYDPANGALVNNRSWNYKVPGHRDIPVDFRVSFLGRSSNAGGVLRSKATGEPALSMSPVVTHALRYALRAARRDAGLPDDWLNMDSGMTPEKVFLLLENSIEQYRFD